MNCSCKVDSICHMDTSNYHSLMNHIVNSSIENTHWSFVAFLLLLFILLLLISYLIFVMSNKNREDRSLIFSEIHKLGQNLNSTIYNSTRSVFDEFCRKSNKCNKYEPSYNESLIKMYFLLKDISDNIDACYNKKNEDVKKFLDELFKFQSNHISIVTFPHSICFSNYPCICKLLDRFEAIAKEIIQDYDNPNKQNYDEEVEEIKKKLEYYITMLKDILNMK